MGKLLADILRGVHHSPAALADGLRIEAITADSRTVKPGSLFVCLKGLAADGHDFAAQAAAQGATAIVVNQSRMAGIDLGGRQTPVIGVDDTREALGRMACAFNDHPGRDLVMIGITGTNGKTTTSFVLEAIIRAAGGVPGVIGTINYRYQGQEIAASFTTPEPLELQALLRRMRNSGVTHVVMEVSSHALALGRIAGLDFDAALFTNLTRDHLDFHRDMEDYYQAKRRLFTDHLRPGAAAVILDDEDDANGWGRRLTSELQAASAGPRVISCGLSGRHTVTAREAVLGLNFTSSVIKVRGEAGQADGENRQSEKKLLAKGGHFAIRTNLVGRFNLKNVLGGVGVAVGLGITPKAIAGGLKRGIRVPGRLEPVSRGARAGLPAVFVDYAHTPDALQNVLATLRGLHPQHLLVVFGCGGDRDPGKRPMMGEIAGRLATVAIITADNSRSEPTGRIMAAIEAGVAASGMPPLALPPGETRPRGYLAIPARGEAIARAIALAGADDIVLISGKGHETYQILGRERLFFDDRQEAAKCLRAKARALNARPPTKKPFWTLTRILAATGGSLAGGQIGGMAARDIVTDSRKIAPGDAFLALSGERFDGLNFADQAGKQGARLIIAQRLPGPQVKLPVVIVPDSLKALGDLAAFRRRQLPRLKVVAVTGSSGKTTVKEMTAAILAQCGGTLKTQGNFNNLIGLPLSLLPAGEEHDFAVLEMGMNRPGEIARLTEIATPDLACINNVQPAHLAGLGSIEGVARAKGELFAGCRSTTTLAVNLEDPWVRGLAKGLANPRLGFGLRPGADVRATRVRPRGQEGISFTLHLKGDRRRVRLNVIGSHNVLNALAAASLALAAGADVSQIVAGLESFRPDDNRLGRRTLDSGLKVINDSYNANPGSMTAALRSVAMIKKGERTVAVLGDMLELGAASPEAHRAVGQEVVRLGFDFLLALGDQASVVVQAAWEAGMSREAARVCAGKAEAAARIEGLLAAGRLMPGDLVLIKGSRGMRMEEVLAALEVNGSRPKEKETDPKPADFGGEK